MVEDPHHVVDCRRRIWVRQDVAERIEGRVPLEGLLVQIGYPFVPTRQVVTRGLLFKKNMEARGTHCSGARRASMAVWGSLKERPIVAKGIWVSPR